MAYFDKIDREFMVRFDLFRRALLDFDAFRSLWARKVVGRGIEVSDLEEGQSRAIVELLSAAENIRQHLGLKWITVLPDDDDEFADGIYLGSRDGQPIAAIEVTGGVCFVGGEGIGSPVDLINDGWKIDGPVRSAALQ